MQLIPLNYKITVRGFWGAETKAVDGFAVDTQYRICAHHIGPFDNWQCTDYDTGFRIGDWVIGKDACIKNAVAILERNIPTGLYAKCQKAALKTLKEARLLK